MKGKGRGEIEKAERLGGSSCSVGGKSLTGRGRPKRGGGRVEGKREIR